MPGLPGIGEFTHSKGETMKTLHELGNMRADDLSGAELLHLLIESLCQSNAEDFIPACEFANLLGSLSDGKRALVMRSLANAFPN
jgi:hypothetical protein